MVSDPLRTEWLAARPGILAALTQHIPPPAPLPVRAQLSFAGLKPGHWVTVREPPSTAVGDPVLFQVLKVDSAGAQVRSHHHPPSDILLGKDWKTHYRLAGPLARKLKLKDLRKESL